METAEYCQSLVALRTEVAMRRAVMSGPDGIFTGVLWPVASTLTCVPPTSITRTFGFLFNLPPREPSLQYASSRRAMGKWSPSMTVNDFRRIALAMPEAAEGFHMGHPDFRVDGKIFA